jgi:hypothetical protein
LRAARPLNTASLTRALLGCTGLRAVLLTARRGTWLDECKKALVDMKSSYGAENRSLIVVHIVHFVNLVYLLVLVPIAPRMTLP